MKFFYRQLFLAFLLLGFAFNAKAVYDTLTIGQAFDWRVGDSLVYAGYTSIYFPPPPQGSGHIFQYGLLQFCIVERIDLPDTIIYQIRHGGNIDTLVVSQLDTPVSKFSYSVLYPLFGGCQELSTMPTCDSWNCFIGNSSTPPIDTFITTYVGYPGTPFRWNITFAEKVGFLGAEYSDNEYYPWGVPGGCGMQLIYFKSDSLIWMDEDYYTGISEQTPAPTFHLTPNPATDQLTITADNQTPVTVSIYSATGVLVGSYQKPAAGALSIPVNNLPPAYYLLKLTGSDGLSTTKGFIVNR